MRGSFFSFLILGNGRDFIGKGGSCQNGATAVLPLRIRCAVVCSLLILILWRFQNG